MGLERLLSFVYWINWNWSIKFFSLINKTFGSLRFYASLQVSDATVKSMTLQYGFKCKASFDWLRWRKRADVVVIPRLRYYHDGRINFFSMLVIYQWQLSVITLYLGNRSNPLSNGMHLNQLFVTVARLRYINTPNTRTCRPVTLCVFTILRGKNPNFHSLTHRNQGHGRQA